MQKKAKLRTGKTEGIKCSTQTDRQNDSPLNKDDYGQ